ncbi:MAG: PAS domain S-box protein, partial [Proteobacteria bacterium]
WLSRIHPEDIDRVNHILGEVLISKAEKLSGEYRFRKADGTYAVVIDRATLLYDEQRMLIRMIGVMEDVTAERMATAYLRESEQRWRTLSNSMSQIAWTSDCKGAVTWFNDRYYQFTGRRENETLGSLWHSVIHPDYRGFVTSSIDYHTRAEAAWEETFPMLSRAGEYRYFLATSHPIRDEEGLITMWLGTATDVTRQIELTNQIREREEHLRIATESANIGTWTMDLTSRQGVWSKRAAAIHGFPERVNFTTDEAEGLVHPEDRHILEKVNSEAFHSTQTFFIDIELRIIRPDGSVRWVALAAKKLEELNTKGGPRVFLVGTLLDLTERVLAQEELR